MFATLNYKNKKRWDMKKLSKNMLVHKAGQQS